MSSMLQSEHGHGDALLFDAHQLLSELMGDGAATATAAAATPPPHHADEEALWPQRASDTLVDAMLFQDIDTLLVTASSSDLPTAIDLHPTTSQHSHHHHHAHHLHDHSVAGYLHAPLSPSAPHTHDSASLASVVDWLSTAHASSTAAAAPLRVATDTDTDVDTEMDESDDIGASDATHTHERELLEREIKFLEAQRDFLQFKADAAKRAMRAAAGPTEVRSTRARLDAAAAKHALDVATRHQAMLADLARQQQQSVHDLGVLLLQSPLNHYRIALMTPMESHIVLCRDPMKRRATLLGLRDSKIDATRQFIEFQAQHIDPAREFFYLDTFEQCGKFYTVDFSVAKLANITVDDVAAIIQDHFVTSNDGIAQLLGCVTNREFFDGLEMTFLNARTVDRVDVPKRAPQDRGFVVQESNAVFYRKSFRDGVTVMMSDYIDDDALHPYRTSGRIRKDISVGIVLRPVREADGTTSVVMKRFSFIKHHFRGASSSPTPEVLHAISTRVILWGQAMRSCILRRQRHKRKTIWLKFAFPRIPPLSGDGAATAGAPGAVDVGSPLSSAESPSDDASESRRSGAASEPGAGSDALSPYDI